MAVDNGKVVGDFDILGSPEDRSKEIASFPDVAEVECYGVRPNLAMYRVLYRKSRPVALRNELEILVRYPFSDKNGVCTCELVGQRSRLRRFVSGLHASGNDPRLLSFRPNDSGSLTQPNVVNLTRIQRALFRQALRSGYYEVPRRVTLTQLAEKVSRNKSSVSKTLTRVERRLAEFAAMAGA
jgi:predicted DNA binding protein